MRDFETLVQLVTDRIMSQLDDSIESSSTKRIYVMGHTTSELLSYFQKLDYSVTSTSQTADAICISELSLGTLSRVALMMPDTSEEQLLLDFLMAKKPVIVVKNQVEYSQGLKTCSYAMKKRILAFEEEWTRFGVDFIKIDATMKTKETSVKTKLLSVSNIEKAGIKTGEQVIISEGTLVTPLAKDYLREQQIELIYRRNEE